MERRSFLEKTSKFLIGGALASPLIGSCTRSEMEDIKPEEKVNPFDNYNFSVNSPPYFDRNYCVQRFVTGATGIVSATCKGRDYDLNILGENGGSVDGIEAFFNSDKVMWRYYVLSDPRGRYLPDLRGFWNRKSTEDLIDVVLRDPKWGDEDHGLGSRVKQYFIREINSGLPSWKLEHMCSHPGYVYLGDWSFNEFKQFTSNLTKAAGIISFAFTGGASAAAYAILSKVGSILDDIDFFVDQINKYTNLNIDKDKERAIYIPPVTKEGTQSLIIFGEVEQKYCDYKTANINQLYPLYPGNFWIYDYNYGGQVKISVEGTVEVKGKELIKLKESSGIEEYVGFNGNALYFYGMNDPSVGRIFLNPAVKLGDDFIHSGKEFPYDSQIIVEKYPDITGRIKGNQKFLSNEKIILANGHPYGGAFKAHEEARITLEKDGNSFDSTWEDYHWFAKNVGKVLVKAGDERIDLRITNVQAKSAAANAPKTIVNKIVESVRSFI